MEKIELSISALAQTSGPQYVLFLQETIGTRKLPVIIGSAEAQAIAMAMNSFSSPRPMTHDLFANSFLAFGIVINEIIIVKVEDNIFYSELVCEQVSTGTKIRIDSRTSDAIALAVRYNCKIYAYDEVLKKAAIDFSEIEQTKPTEEKVVLKKIKNLQKRLEKAVKEEKYEEASQLKNEISKLKKQL